MVKTSREIRESFLKYFQGRGHEVVPSSSLIPENDKSIMFTNAGMVQFKRIFQGEIKSKYSRATTVQKCLRAGGKHNDLENVGFTARHHTFFEMLGNFSFGDYFKEDAISYAWEYLTDIIGLDKKHLYVSVYNDDDEAFDIWNKKVGIEASRIYRFGEKDNFWSMGDTGPCGPCSEIFYDRGKKYGCDNPNCEVGCDCDRFLEVWNLVFMQFNRQEDGSMEPLPAPSIDTGMGLERLLSVINDTDSNYDTDCFLPIIHFTADLAGVKFKDQYDNDMALRVIADHARSAAFLIQENVIPSNEAHGYVLRRIVRRALRFGGKLGFTEPFFYKVVEKTALDASEFYPELKGSSERTKKIVYEEELKFQETLYRGLPILYKKIEEQKTAPITGADVFLLSDTYGIPVDVTDEILREHNITYDTAEYHRELNKQKEQSRATGKAAGGLNVSALSDLSVTTFLGYTEPQTEAKVLALLNGQGERLDVSGTGNYYILTDSTVFYGESGGQVGDTGTISINGKEIPVINTEKHSGYFLHAVELKGDENIKPGDACSLSYDSESRNSIARNHTATHLLHSALREVLGSHVKQGGSLVEPTRLRFDFSHNTALSDEELERVETLVNEKILENVAVTVEELSLEEALDRGATALFDEKYTSKVRVVTAGDFSMELCGGTHVKRVGDIGLFKVLSETGVSAGVRRIEAVTGKNFLKLFEENEQSLIDLRKLLKASKGDEVAKANQLLEANKKLQKEIEALKEKLTSGGSGEGEQDVTKVEDFDVIVKKAEFKDSDFLRKSIDTLKESNPKSVSLVYFSDEDEGKVSIVCGVTDTLTNRLQAGKLVKEVTVLLGGKGGGRADFAQGGGTDLADLDTVLKGFPDLVKQQLT